MDVEPSLITKFGDWILAIIGALVGVLWSFLKADINRAHDNNKSNNQHINTLYMRAEEDIAATRQIITELDHRMSDKLDRLSRDMLTEIREMIRAKRGEDK